MQISQALYTEETLQKKVLELADMIQADYDRGERVHIIGILKGASIFIADLIRKLDLDIRLDFMSVSSYGLSTESTGTVKIIKDLDMDIKDQHVLIVEDIVDTGLTLDYIKDYLWAREPKSLKICTLLDKPVRRKVELIPDYIGFEVDDVFIVGYGIDCKEQFRNIPYIAFVKED